MTKALALLPTTLAIAMSVIAAPPAYAETLVPGPDLGAFDSRQGAVAFVTGRGNLTLRVRSAAGRTRVVARGMDDGFEGTGDFADLRAGSDARGATVFVFSRGQGNRQSLWAVDAAAGGARKLTATDRRGRRETRPSLYAGQLGYFAGSRLVTSPFRGGPERRVAVTPGKGPVNDAAIGPGLFLAEFEGTSSNGGPTGVGVLRGGRYEQLRNTPNGEETSSSVDYLNVLDGQLHFTVSSRVKAADGIYRAPVTSSARGRVRAVLPSARGTSPLSGNTYVVARRAGGRTDLVTRRLTFRR